MLLYQATQKCGQAEALSEDLKFASCDQECQLTVQLALGDLGMAQNCRVLSRLSFIGGLDG